MASLQHGRYVLAVRDLATSVAFYCDKLGFTEDFSVDGWSFLLRDHIHLMLGHCPDALPAAALGDHSYFAYIDVDDIDALYQQFSARGLVTAPPQDQPWGMREFKVLTPDGHRLMFGQSLD